MHFESWLLRPLHIKHVKFTQIFCAASPVLNAAVHTNQVWFFSNFSHVHKQSWPIRLLHFPTSVLKAHTGAEHTIIWKQENHWNDFSASSGVVLNVRNASTPGLNKLVRNGENQNHFFFLLFLFFRNIRISASLLDADLTLHDKFASKINSDFCDIFPQCAWCVKAFICYFSWGKFAHISHWSVL